MGGTIMKQKLFFKEEIMRNTKAFLIITAIFSVFLLAGVALAANTANINVTSEPINAGAACDKSGGITLTFDRNTILMDQDQITMDLTLNVTLCRNINIVISNGPGADLENIIDTENVGWDEVNSVILGGPVVLT
jgi:spore coat protein U-like protein